MCLCYLLGTLTSTGIAKTFSPVALNENQCNICVYMLYFSAGV